MFGRSPKLVSLSTPSAIRRRRKSTVCALLFLSPSKKVLLTKGDYTYIEKGVATTPVHPILSPVFDPASGAALSVLLSLCGE